jgi:hypothetical protein
MSGRGRGSMRPPGRSFGRGHHHQQQNTTASGDNSGFSHQQHRGNFHNQGDDRGGRGGQFREGRGHSDDHGGRGGQFRGGRGHGGDTGGRPQNDRVFCLNNSGKATTNLNSFFSFLGQRNDQTLGELLFTN